MRTDCACRGLEMSLLRTSWCALSALNIHGPLQPCTVAIDKVCHSPIAAGHALLQLPEALYSERSALVRVTQCSTFQAAERRAQEAEEEQLRMEQESQAELRSLRARLSEEEAGPLLTEVRFLLHSTESIKRDLLFIVMIHTGPCGRCICVIR